MKIVYKGQNWWNGDDEGSHSISEQERNTWTYIHVAEGVTTIEARSFHRCRNIKYVYIPDTVEEIKKCAFEGCANLVWVRLPRNLKMIGWGAFFGCRLLPSLVVPSSCQDIDACAFAECQSLIIINLPIHARVGRKLVNRCRDLLDPTTFMANYTTGVVDDNSINLWLKTRYKHLILHDICAKDNVSVEKINECFLQHGADIGKIVDDHHGLTALHVLVANPYATNAMVQAYLRKCEGIVTIGETRWWTLLHFLSMNPKLSIDFLYKCVEKGAYNVLVSVEDRDEQLFMKLEKDNIPMGFPKPASVVLVGCWDEKQGEIINIGSGFIAETHHGLIVTSRSNVSALGDKANLTPIIGVNRKGTPDTVWQYTAEMALGRNNECFEKNLDCCILKVKSKFNVPIPTNKLFFSGQKVTKISHDELKQFGCLSTTKERPGRCVVTVGFTARTNCPMELSIVSKDEISNAPSFIFGALDRIEKESDIITLKTSYRRGISGAPCLNQEGQVIGIVSKGREEYGDKCKLVAAAAIRMGLHVAVRKEEDPYSIERSRKQENRYDHLEYKKKRAMRRARREQAV